MDQTSQLHHLSHQVKVTFQECTYLVLKYLAYLLMMIHQGHKANY